ncbi:MAG: polysaccharide deacetylase family protein [Bacteroidetes bacterium]|nr:polysaccharide deacetylase family protein [Bacteroidota bacterium]
MKNFIFFLPVFTCITLSCQSGTDKKSATIQKDTARTNSVQADSAKGGLNSKPADASAILARKQVPVLCYHQIREWKTTDSKRAKDYIVPVEVFKQQMKALADSGYHTISPDELYDYLTRNKSLPAKPIMLTFDDTDLGQYTIGFPELKKYGFKGVFFIMTVSLNRPNYMSKEQVKELSDAGNTIGSHTWDHHNVKQYQGKDWEIQIDKPTRQLGSITGKPIRYFAYPFGLWNKQAIPELKKRNFIAAFQLVTKRDDEEPLYTIRRIIVPGYWSLVTLQHAINSDFH